MILHAVSMVAVFVDQLAFEPVAFQCAPNSGQDPLWARLFFEAIPSIFALGIAALVFYWNGRREHKQWLLDQKKPEWDEIHGLVSDVWSILHPIFKKDELDLVTNDTLFFAVRKLRLPLAHTKFIARPFNDNAFEAKFDKFFITIAEKGPEIQGSLDFLRSKQASEFDTNIQSKITLKTSNARGDLIQQLSVDFEQITRSLKEMMANELKL
jgi:hypothetical protein